MAAILPVQAMFEDRARSPRRMDAECMRHEGFVPSVQRLGIWQLLRS